MLLSKFRLIFILQFIFIIPVFSQPDVKVYIQEARTLMLNNDYLDAIQKLDVCIEIRPGDYDAHYYRGVCKYYLKDNLGALDDLNNSISMFNPLLNNAYHYRSLVKYRLGDFDGAIKDINHVIEGQENDPQLYVERAFFKLSNQNFNGVIGDCNTALRMKSVSGDLYLCKGMAENALNKFDSALINYNMALKINPKDIDIYIRIGMTDDNLDKPTDAIEEYNQALKIDSASTLAYYNRAEANIKLKNDPEALKDFNRVINYDPMNAPAYFNKGVLEADNGRYEDALADFDKVLALSPKNIQALYNRAKIKQQIKDYRGALADYNSTIDLFPYLVEAYYDRARLKEIIKDYTGAKEDYKLGKLMSELSHNRDTVQKANDSTNLMHLLTLNSGFTNGNQKLSDTANIDLMPVFCIIPKQDNSGKSICNPIYFKKSNQEFLDFCLTNKKTTTENSTTENLPDASNEPIKDSSKQLEKLLQNAIRKTNMQLFRAALKDYDKIIELYPACAVAYFARGIDICKEVEMLGQLNGTGQDTYINKTYKVVNDPGNDKYKMALEDFTKLIQIEPDFAYGYYDRAYVKYKLHDFDGAIDDYNNAIQIKPDLAEAFYNRGLLLYCENYKMNACEDFGKAGELGLTEAYLIIKLYCDQVTK
jgi:tetratricopeptide (TPR) repeat protein